jgi:hypothetical protein
MGEMIGINKIDNKLVQVYGNHEKAYVTGMIYQEKICLQWHFNINIICGSKQYKIRRDMTGNIFKEEVLREMVIKKCEEILAENNLKEMVV